MSPAIPLPPYRVLAAALRVTTERLAREVAAPSAIAPDWNPVEWIVARAASAMQGISVLLANRLAWRGPQGWQDFLSTQRRQAQHRHEHIGFLLRQIDGCLSAAGLACVALKGSALRRYGMYAAGERPMGDVDLLVQPGELARVAQALRSLDYLSATRTRRHLALEPRLGGPLAFGEHPDNPLKIELHEVVAEPLPWRPVDITAALWTQKPRPGLNDYAHSRELMRHLLLHAAGNIRAHALRQVQLHDISELGATFRDDDWAALLDTPDSGGGAWWMWPVLELTGRYYPASVPTRAADFRQRCPPLLRAASTHHTLARISWSNLRIAAFPGICWARSLREALGFMRSRIAPRREALEELELSLRMLPSLRQVPWYGEKHVARMIRWVFSRPPRVQTLVSVRAAFADDAGDILHGA
jgi:hypothetical protein